MIRQYGPLSAETQPGFYLVDTVSPTALVISGPWRTRQDAQQDLAYWHRRLSIRGGTPSLAIHEIPDTTRKAAA